MQAPRLGVVGTGVIGVSTALLAQKRGYDVTLYSDAPLLETTSAKAAASFKPYEVAWNELAAEMLKRALGFFSELAETVPTLSGVRWHTHWVASSTPLEAAPYLSAMKEVEDFEFPHVPGAYRYGRRLTTFFVDIPVYLPWLRAEFVRHGGQVVQLPRRFRDLEELGQLPYEVIFNCTGLGSRSLCGDEKLYPIKGQLAIVAPRPEMDWSIAADGFYVYPRSGDTVLGGTAERHVDTETNDTAVLGLILRGNRRILPDLTDASILRATAGLRPYREQSIRLEGEAVGDRWVVHNYGHGGAGVTLSWGSAELALELALGLGAAPPLRAWRA